MSGSLVLQAAPAAGVSFLSLPPSIRSSVAVASDGLPRHPFSTARPLLMLSHSSLPAARPFNSRPGV